jgi:cell wall-associated NlpC family hydrolase
MKKWLARGLMVLAFGLALTVAARADDVVIRITGSDCSLLRSPQYDAEVVREAEVGEELIAVTTVDDFYLVKDEVTGSFLYVHFSLAEQTDVPLPETYHVSGQMPMPQQVDLSYWQVAPGEEMNSMKLRTRRGQQMLVAPNGKEYPAQYEYNYGYTPAANGARLVHDARRFLGTKYVLGGTSTEGIDCSGLTKVCLANQGIDVVHRSSLQALHGRYVHYTELQTGDVIFFRDEHDSRYLSHVGIYVGGGRFIHASASRGGVVISRLSEAYFKSHYGFARRF